MKIPFKTKKEPEEKLQFELPISEPYFNRYHALKQRFLLKLKQFETKTFVRSFANWFFIIISISFILVQFQYMSRMYELLPSEVPLYRYIFDLGAKLSRKDNLYAIPMISIFVLLGSVIASYNWFNRKKSLSMFNLFFMCISIMSLTFALANILAQYYE